MSGNCDIEIRFDDVSGDYYIVWAPPPAISSGSTRIEALRDLREVVHFCVDSTVDQKSERLYKGGLADGLLYNTGSNPRFLFEFFFLYVALGGYLSQNRFS